MLLVNGSTVMLACVFVQGIRLCDQCWPWLSIVALHAHRHDIAAFHVQPSTDPATAYNRSSISPDRSAAAASRDCRRHSFLKFSVRDPEVNLAKSRLLHPGTVRLRAFPDGISLPVHDCTALLVRSLV